MKSVKPNGSAEAAKPSERELTASNDPLPQGDGEMAANGLGSLVRRVSDASRREIRNLVGELQTLDKKLENDGDRIQNYIEEYAGLNQQIMQLTTIISDSVKKIPDGRGIH
jgi:hypothetical protein